MKRCKIIAEVGANHLGDMELARDHILAAAEAGADFVKFQSWQSIRLSPVWSESLSYYQQCELSEDDHFFLAEECRKAGVMFLSTAFDPVRLGFLKSVSPDYIKISSIDAHNTDFIRKALQLFNYLIVSTGMTTTDELSWLSYLLKDTPHTLLHCVSEYPCKHENGRMNRMTYLKEFSPSVGLSCHSQDIFAATTAIARGADIVEKHFILKHTEEARDDKVSITPDQLKSLCQYRDIVNLLDSDLDTEPSDAEMEVRKRYEGKWSD